MNKDHPNWKDRSTDPDGFNGTLECQMLIDEAERLLHRVQTAIKFLHEHETLNIQDPDRRFTSPKHQRVGIDNALVSNGALVALLIEKGVIKAKDWYETYLEFLEREVEGYRARLKAKLGVDVNLL